MAAELRSSMPRASPVTYYLSLNPTQVYEYYEMGADDIQVHAAVVRLTCRAIFALCAPPNRLSRQLIDLADADMLFNMSCARSVITCFRPKLDIVGHRRDISVSNADVHAAVAGSYRPFYTTKPRDALV